MDRNDGVSVHRGDMWAAARGGGISTAKGDREARRGESGAVE